MRTYLSSLVVVVCSVVLAGCSCGPKECPAGANTCACKAGSVCDTGLVCTANVCSPGTVGGLSVGDAAARGCEVLLTEQAGTTVGQVEFQAGVVGTWVREAPRVAITFVAPRDAALPAGGVTLGLSGPASGLVLSKASCVDAAGKKLPASSVSVQ